MCSQGWRSMSHGRHTLPWQAKLKQVNRQQRPGNSIQPWAALPLGAWGQQRRGHKAGPQIPICGHDTCCPLARLYFLTCLLWEQAGGSVAAPLGASSALSTSLLLAGSQGERDEGNHLFHLEAKKENLKRQICPLAGEDCQIMPSRLEEPGCWHRAARSPGCKCVPGRVSWTDCLQMLLSPN